MTSEELNPYIGKPVRLTLTDGRVIAGTLHSLYALVSTPLRDGAAPVREIIPRAESIAEISEASDDPAAVE